MHRGRFGYDFEDCLEVGDEGMLDVVDFLYRNPRTKKVIDLTENEKYQKKDIDFEWHYYAPDGTEKRLLGEIKTDRHAHKTNNLFLEVYSCYERKTQGCFMYTECDWLFYYIQETRKLIVLPMEKFRNWVLERQKKYRRAFAQSKLGRDGSFKSQGILFPITELYKFNETLYILNI